MLQEFEDERNQRNRTRGSLGRKFAFVLLPLVLIPLLLLGGVAYWRMSSILQQEANNQMIYAIEGQSATLQDWASLREQNLFIRTQSEALIQAADPLLLHPEDQPAVSALVEELKDLHMQQGEDLFREMLVVRISDRLIVSATDTEHIGKKLESLPDHFGDDVHTYPIYDDPVFAPETLSFLSVVPFRTIGTQPDFYLVGVNTGSKVVQLMEELQVFWQRRGVYRVERGETYLLLLPDILFELPRYATRLNAVEASDHPVLRVSDRVEASTLEYEDPDGEALLSAYQWIPDWNLAVIVELPKSDIFSGISELTPFMIILIVLASLLTISVAFLVTNRMLQPLTSLAEFADRISHGEWLYRVPEDRQDELGALAASLNRMAEELGAIYQSLETRVEDRTRQIRTASEVARAIISIPNLNELLRQAVQLIQQRFGYDHVSIFLLDPNGQHAVLRESAGVVDEILHTPGRKIEISSQTTMGWVSETVAPLVITEASNQADTFKDGLLSGLKSKAVIPLQVAENPLGVIDVQSKELDVFSQEELEILQTLADQLSSAIENARLAQESADAAERARLISGITGQLSGILEPEQVLQTAAQELHRALGDAEIIVRLTPPDEVSQPFDEGSVS